MKRLAMEVEDHPIEQHVREGRFQKDSTAAAW